MRRSRAPDHRDALDSMQQGISSSIGGLTCVFMRQMADNAAARNDPAARNSNRITDLYKHRRLADEAGPPRENAHDLKDHSKIPAHVCPVRG